MTPNLESVAPGIWRSGQPQEQDWPYIASLGIKWDIKLDTGNEGDDDAAFASNITTIRLPISWWQEFFGVPQSTIDAAVAAMESDGTLVHCKQGVDRTGLIVACYRLKHGAFKIDAESEMLQHGFHKLYCGLWAAWQRQ